MRAFAQSWFCLIVLLSLALFAFLSGLSLELAARSSLFSLQHYRPGIPISTLTAWFFVLHVPRHNPLLIICFYPVLCTSAYWFWLLRSTPDPIQRHVAFAFAAIAAFVLMACFLLAGVLAYALPWLPMSGLLLPAETIIPPIDQGVFAGLMCFLLANLGLSVWAFLPRRNNDARSNSA